MISIRRAEIKDIPMIMDFLDEHWKRNHILARNREFFEWQFVSDGRVNCYIGIDDSCHKIYGLLGIILYNGTNNPDISGSIWKTIKSENPMLGLDINDYANKDLNVRCSMSAGMSKKAIDIYELQGYKGIKMDHFYRLADLDNYKVASIKDKSIPKIEDTKSSIYEIFNLSDMREVISDEMLRNRVLSKDYDYINWRYFNHPIYNYKFYAIKRYEEKPKSMIVVREECAQGRKIVKIVDFYGDIKDIAYMTYGIDRLMKDNNYEYIDIYSFGIPTDIYKAAGFVYCNDDDNIIPNYFHPFIKKNIDLWMLDPNIPNAVLFRGDGDQDRPS